MSSNEKNTRNRILQTTWELLEKSPGRSLNMSEIAKATGISRQALYLHFDSRTELLIATTHYVDEVKGLEQRLRKLQSAKSGEEMLRSCVHIWGNYIPEIYSVSKALMMTKDNDEAAAAAWVDIMGCLRDVCEQVIQTLKNENKLSPNWNQQHATDYFWTMISIQNWEQLTLECGWKQDQYISNMTEAITTALVLK